MTDEQIQKLLSLLEQCVHLHVRLPQVSHEEKVRLLDELHELKVVFGKIKEPEPEP